MNDSCPICGYRHVQILPGDGYPAIRCERCGEFTLEGPAYDLLSQWMLGKHPDRSRDGRFAASHAIRHMQGKGGQAPFISAAQLEVIWSQPLPNPQRQADNLILALGNENLPIEEYVSWRVERFCSEVGTRDDPTKGLNAGFNLIAKRLSDQKLIEHNINPQAPCVAFRLTFDGWTAYEALRRAVVESKSAFMAMSFSNPVLDRIVTDHFVSAVRETGYELFRIDARPKAGLIDNRMRVDIRAAKFVVCDLTDENRGAYWEAGFAEGAQKPVFYTCEKDKFDKVRTHFDTEHMFTIKWVAADPTSAVEELKAAIRNEFPTEANH